MIIIKTIDIRFLRKLREVNKGMLFLLLLGTITVPYKPVETTFYWDHCVKLAEFLFKGII